MQYNPTHNAACALRRVGTEGLFLNVLKKLRPTEKAAVESTFGCEITHNQVIFNDGSALIDSGNGWFAISRDKEIWEPRPTRTTTKEST